MRETDSTRTRASNRLIPDATPVEPAPDPVYAEPARRVYDEPARTTYDVEPVRMTYAEPPLFASVAEPALFASTEEEPRRRSGLSIWFAAAASLVLGIVIGFASGYRAGQGSPGAPAAEAPAPTSGAASTGQPFSESTVPDPVRLEPKEAVPSPSPRPAPATAPRQQAPPAPAAATPRPARVAPNQAAPGPAVVEEKPPLTGPASLQVVSRPAGAEVLVDGKSVGRTPLSMEMNPGAHEVRLSLPGFKGWATTVDVKAGSTTRVSGSLEQ